MQERASADEEGAKLVDAPEIEAYLARADELRLQIDERERHERAAENPSLIAESDLTNHHWTS